MYNYISNYQEDTIKRYQALYDKFKGIYHALLLAQDEGVFEITVRSQTGAVSVPVDLGDGTEIAAMMVENFSKRVDRVETLLNKQIEEVGHEIAYDRKCDEKQEQEREAANKQEWAAYETQQRSLAKQAAATAAPPQKGPGRPKRAAAPQPQVMEAVGALAAQVPMNGAGKLPGGQTTNQPQG